MKNKSLRDWTLEELRTYCSSQKHCADCSIYTRRKADCPFFVKMPCSWDFSDPPRWTAEDIEDAKAVDRLFPWVNAVSRNSITGEIMIQGNALEKEKHFGYLFPTLQKGETVTLREILHEENRDVV